MYDELEATVLENKRKVDSLRIKKNETLDEEYNLESSDSEDN